MRDHVGAAQPQAGRLRAHGLERRPHRPDHEVPLVERHRRRRPRPSTVIASPARRRPRPSARRAGRGRGRGQSKPGPRLALVAGTRDRDRPGDERHVSAGRPPRPRPRRRRRPRCRRCSVNVASAVSMSLSPWPVTVTTTVRPAYDVALAELVEQPGDAGGRRRLDEDAVAGGQLALRGEDLVVGDRAEPAAGLAPRPPPRASTRRGCRSGSRWPRSPGRGTARRSPAGAAPSACQPRITGCRVARPSVGVLRGSPASTPRCCRRCRPAGRGTSGASPRKSTISNAAVFCPWRRIGLTELTSATG